MLVYLIYIIVFLILAYVVFITGKAINIALETKQNNKFNLNKTKEGLRDENLNILNKINELKKLHNEGVLSDEEFKKAKEKILI